jgi:flagellar hook-associated protein 2
MTATSFGGLAPTGSYSIAINQLAKTQTSVSKGFESTSYGVGPVSGTITMGGKVVSIDFKAKQQISTIENVGGGFLAPGKITITQDNGYFFEFISNGTQTLGGLAAAISGDPNFDASIGLDGKLNIASVAVGTNNAFTITFEEDDPDNPVLSENLKISQTQEAMNASLINLQQEIMNAAKAADVGINVSLIYTGPWNSSAQEGGYRLMISAKETGTANAFTFGGAIESVLSFDTTQAAQDAELTINGVFVSSGTNTLKSAIEGVTINLKNTTPGDTVTLDLGVNDDAIVSAIKDMITAYNEVSAFINSQFSFNYNTSLNSINGVAAEDMKKSGNYGTSGVLSGDPTLRSVQYMLQSIVMGSAVPLAVDPDNPYRSMRQLGINVENDGTLNLDEAVLRKALAEDFDRTSKFFLGYDTPAGTKAGGMLANLGDALKGLTDPLRNPIKNAVDGLTSNINNVLKTIDAYELRLQVREDQLYAQFQAADEALRMMNVLLGSISSSLATLSNTNNNK